MLIKTNLEETTKFSELLNFNYKFRSITSELNELKNFENIRIQTNTFKSITELKSFIEDITSRTSSILPDIDNLYTYSYVCIDSKFWNENTEFKDIENQYFKFYYNLPNDYNSDFSKDYSNIISKLKYLKQGFTKTAFTLFTSGIETANFTKLPYAYENEQLYIFILRLYQKIFISKTINDCENAKSKNINDIMNRYVSFMDKFYHTEISNSETTSDNYKKWENILNIKELNSELLNKYNLMYKEISLLQNKKHNKIMSITVGITLILTIINIILFTLK